MSTHRVEVVPVVLEPHPDADRLSLVKVHGYDVVVRSEDWRDQPLGAYLPPDSYVPDTAEYAFLKGKRRIRAQKLRGIVSYGLLMPAPEGAEVGDDVMVQLGITQYQPPVLGQWARSQGSTSSEPGPEGYFEMKYDLENYQRYPDALIPGEQVIVTEKLHGANAKFLFLHERMWVGSRNEWKKMDEGSPYWRILAEHPEISRFCAAHPGHTLYGEIYGWVQELRYGAKPGQTWFAAFDLLLPSNTWADPAQRDGLFDGFLLETVPLLGAGPWSDGWLRSLAEGPSHIEHADHLREGCVIEPATPHDDPEVGRRVKLKLVSADYLLR